MKDGCVVWKDYEAQILNAPTEEEILKHIEYCGRICYNSHQMMTDGTAIPFVKGLIRKNHLSVIEHVSITVMATMDRGLSHEWVRHRIGSYSQQSTRYCRYKNHVPCIMPCTIHNIVDDDDVVKKVFMETVNLSCESYIALLESKVAPEIARGVLPTCLATTLIATHNLREWRHIFLERYFNIKAHPDMRYLMGIIYNMMNEKYPTIFDDLKDEVADYFGVEAVNTSSVVK